MSSAIDFKSLSVTRTTAPKAKVSNDKLVFGAVTSDHMLEIDWHSDNGWSKPVITPYHNLSLDPASSVFHYGLEAFEGMKAYKDANGKIRLFRPDLNMQRMTASMKKLSMPELDQEGFLKCIERLVKEEQSWIPEGEGFSLYLRPTVIATHPYLGVAQTKSIKLFCITCPVGPYYPEGFKPVRLLAESDAVRAWPGGIGDAKVGGNYAPTIRVQVSAASKGFSQVLWLFGDKKEVTEVGTMNFFAFWVNEKGKKELVTPPLDGTILPGVTRQSILDLARTWKEFDVSERKFTIHDIVKASKENRLLEAFGAGTAAVVSPIKALSFEGEELKVPLDPKDPSAGAGPMAKRFWNELTSIQYGKVDHPWSVIIN